MKKYFRFIIVALLISFPFKVNALTGTLSINCGDNKVKVGGTITCSVTGTTDTTIYGIEAKVSMDATAALSAFNVSSGAVWHTFGVKGDGSTVYAITKSAGVNGSFDVGSFALTFPENIQPGNVTISLSDFDFVIKNANDKTEDVTEGITGSGVTINVVEGDDPSVSEDKGLKILTCTSEQCYISPPLSDGETSYGVWLENNSINSFSISAVAKNSEHSVVFTDYDTGETLNPDNITFKTSGGKSSMLINISVGTGSNLVTYALVVQKASTEVARLGSLTVGGKTINLVNGVYDYDIALGNVDGFKINATVADSANFEITNPEILDREFSASGYYNIDVAPKDSSSGISSQRYILNISLTTSGGSTPSTPSNPTVNPKTGSFTAIVMAIVLILSLFATLYLYKQNMAGYKKQGK